VIGQMATAWVFTIPAAAVLAGIAWEISNLFGMTSNAGPLVIAILAALGALGLFHLAQRNKITAADLDRTNITPEIEAERAEAFAGAAAA
jgi:inorganic phosphate transporter, PiT family